MRISIYILAAGESLRMGTAKQLLNWGGIPLLKHVALQAIESEIGDVNVILGAHRDEIVPCLEGLSLNSFQNSNWSRGPGSSIKIAVREARIRKVESALLVAGDQPFLTPSSYQKLRDTWREEWKDLERIVAAQYSAGVIGIPVIFASHYFDEISALPDDCGARAVLASHPERVTTVTLPEARFDLDTQEDYSRALTLL